MKSFLTFKWVVLIILTSFFSCADSETDLSDVDLINFLNKNNGTEWLLNNDDLKVYIRLNDDSEQLIEQWKFQEEGACYEYNSNIFFPGTSKILQNNTSELRIEGDPVLSDYECMILSRLEDTLKVTIIINEWQEEFVYFTLSTLQVDDLTVCNGKEENKIHWIFQ